MLRSKAEEGKVEEPTERATGFLPTERSVLASNTEAMTNAYVDALEEAKLLFLERGQTLDGVLGYHHKQAFGPLSTVSTLYEDACRIVECMRDWPRLSERAELVVRDKLIDTIVHAAMCLAWLRENSKQLAPF